MDFAQILANNIKTLSKQQNKQLIKVLADCELNKGFIYDLERKGSLPSIDKIYKLACYFNVSLDYLVGRTDNPEVNK